MTSQLARSWDCDVASAGSSLSADTIIVGLFRGLAPAMAAEDLSGVDVSGLAALDPAFTGERLQVTLASAQAAGRSQRVAIVGLGDRSDFGPGIIRSAASVAARALGERDGGRVVSLLAMESPDVEGVSAAIEGHLLGGWSYARDSQAADVRGALTIGVPAAAVGRPELGPVMIDRAILVSGVTNWVRQLVETPSNLLGPEQFADAVEALARELTPDLVTVTRWGVETLSERGFGGTLGVGSGSARGPLVIELSVAGDDPIGLAGKGITFDSGGVNLKRSASELAWMKSDMAAAASVAGAVVAAAALGLTAQGGVRAMHAILPVAENMPGGAAARPGDVIVHPGGRTTEITDTDSEGRLVLADAVAWLASTAPTAIIDVGTLTDSGALGTEFWGCWASSPALASALVAAGDRAGDRGWLLPLHDAYRELISSRVADASNSPLDAEDSGQLAATYLRPFAGDVPWVHVDNGAGAWLERDSGAWAAGPTGTPVRALIEYLAPRA